MLRASLSVLFAVCCVCPLLGEDTHTADDAPKYIVYNVKITEYQLAKPIKPAQSAAGVLAMLSKSDEDKPVRAIETIRFSVVNGVEGTVNFARKVWTALEGSGRISRQSGRPVGRNSQAVDVGTLARATVMPQGQQTAITVRYESSRLVKAEAADLPPDIHTVSVESSLMLDLGKPVLLGSSSYGAKDGPTSVVVLTVTRD